MHWFVIFVWQSSTRVHHELSSLLHVHARPHAQCDVNITAAACDIVNSNKVAGPTCTCLPGFKGSITWNGDQPSGTCTPTQCTGTHATAPANGEVSLSDGVKHGSVATFTCKAGFKRSGAASITCDAKSADTAWPLPSEAPKCTGS